MSGRGTWTTPELDRIRRLFPITPPEQLARLLGRSEDAVRRQAERMFAGPERHGAFTAREDQRLRDAFGVHDLDTIAMLLRRPMQAVVDRVADLRCRFRHGPWRPAETRRLRRLYGTRQTEDLVLGLARTAEDIERQADELCLAKDKRRFGSGSMPRWTAAEVSRLRELYPTRDNLEIARELGRSVASVANKASQLGLGKSLERLRAMGRSNLRFRSRR